MVQADSVYIVFVTSPDQETAERIAKTLVEKQLAACVNIIHGMRSIYRWEDKIVDDKELLLIIKTRTELLKDQIIPLVKDLHPYEVPEIIALPVVGGETSYLDWILKETG